MRWTNPYLSEQQFDGRHVHRVRPLRTNMESPDVDAGAEIPRGRVMVKRLLTDLVVNLLLAAVFAFVLLLVLANVEVN